MKIAVYTMAKNEAKHVEAFAETTKGADIVVVTDTGSTDGTPEMLEERGIDVHHARIVPWRFDIGTNCALCNVPADVDVCVKLDLDERLYTVDGSPWREEIERQWDEGVGRLRYWYTWSWIVPGKVPGSKFRTSHIHGRSGFHWMHPGHAALTNMHSGKMAETDILEIHHYMDHGKKRPDYIPLLEMAVHENRCPRTLFYLGREYLFSQRWEDCYATMKEYLDRVDSTWPAERANAMRMIGRAMEEHGDPDEALSWYLRANAELPNVRDIWWELLRFFSKRGQAMAAAWAGEKCLSLKERDSQWLSGSAEAWKVDPFLFTAWAFKTIGRHDGARQCMREALAREDADPEHIRQFAMDNGITI